MRHSPSMLVRATSSVVMAAFYFTFAVGLWSYRSEQLGISAAVTQNQARVSMNFDELQTPAWEPPHTYPWGVNIGSYYQSYGIKFSTKYYDKTSGWVENPVAWASQSPPNTVASPQLPVPSAPNFVVGGADQNTTIGSVGMPLPYMPIILKFVTPSNPTQSDTTSYVKFNLSTNIPSVTCPPANCQWTSATTVIDVNVYNAGGTSLGTRRITTTGTHQIEFATAGIAKVEVIQGPVIGVPGGTPSDINYITDPLLRTLRARFALDDLEFNMPGWQPAPTMPNGTLTMSKSSYPVGEQVTATLANTGTVNIACPNQYAFEIYWQPPATGDAEPAPQLVHRAAIPTVSPSGQQALTWDQKHYSTRAQVATGSYTAKATCTNFSRTASFTITQGTVQASGTLTMSKPSYSTGETVSWTLKNTGSTDITCAYRDPWKITDSGGRTIFEPQPNTTDATIIRTGQEKTWTWDQKGSDGRQVAAGAYTVAVTCTNYSGSAGFTIGAPQTGDFTVTPTEGYAPLPVTATYSGGGGTTNLLTSSFTELNETTQNGTATYTKDPTTGKLTITNVPVNPTCTASKSWDYDLQEFRGYQWQWKQTIPDQATVEAKIGWDENNNAQVMMLGKIALITEDGHIIMEAGYHDGSDGYSGSLIAIANDNQANYPTCNTSNNSQADSLRSASAATGGGNSGTATIRLVRAGNTITAYFNDTKALERTIPSGLTPAGVAVVASRFGNNGAAYSYGTYTVESLTLTHTYNWDWGDGTVETTSVPSAPHTYPQPGTYTVTLRIGATMIGSRQVVVRARPITPQTSPTPTPTSTGATVTQPPAKPPALKLVASGGSLPFNLAIAGLLSLVTTYLLMRRRKASEA